MIALPDMPDITTQDMQALFTAQAEMPDTPLRAPPRMANRATLLFCRKRFSRHGALHGRRKARGDLGVTTRPACTPCPAERALTDLDTPEAWAAWRAKR